MFSEAQLIAVAMIVLGGIALIVTSRKNPAERDQQSGEKDRRSAMNAAQA